MFAPSLKGPFRVLSILSLFMAMFLTTSAQDILTNDSVVKMVKAGLSETVILEMVRTRPGKYLVTPESLSELKQQGVTEKVLLAMIAKSSPPATTEPHAGPSRPDPARPNPISSSQPEGTWEIRPAKDAITGEEDFDAHLVAKNDGSQRMDISAWCGLEQNVSGVMRMLGQELQGRQEIDFRFTYQSAIAGKGMKITVQQLSPTTVTPGISSYEVNGPVNIAYALATVKLDSHLYRDQLMGDSNKVTMSFYNAKLANQMAGMMTKAAKDNPFAPLVASMIAGAGAFESSVTVNDLLKAHALVLEVPMTDGTMLPMDLRIAHPTFRKFIDRCSARFEAEAPPPTPTGPVVRPSPLKTLTNRQFNGTVDGFTSAFPGYLERAAAAMGLDAKNYRSEADFIHGAVRTCSQITPEMYSRAAAVRRGRPDFSQLGEQYRICNAGTTLVSQRVNRPNADRGIELNFVENYGSSGADRGFGAIVSFSRVKGDSFPNLAFDNYGIVVAMIYPSEAAVKHPPTSTALQNINRKFDGTADQFAKALPGLVEKAATALSLDPKNYEAETAKIVAMVHDCLAITPQMLRGTRRQFPNGSYGPPDVRTLGEPYAACGHGLVHLISDDIHKSYDKDVERGLVLFLTARGGWGSGQGAMLQVYFSTLKSEGSVYEKHFDTLGVIEAAVH